MDIRNTYRMQQQFYSGFIFVPLRSVKKHNYFLYTVYNNDHKLHPVFNSVLNKEVLDNNYILAIYKTISSSSVPLTQAMATDLKQAADMVSVFFQEHSIDHNELPDMERTIRNLYHALGKFGEVEQRLINDLKKLLSNYQFTGLYSINCDDIDNILDVLHEVYKGIQRSIKRLLYFSSDLNELPLTEKNREPGLKAKNCVNNLISGLHRWCRVQTTLINQVQEWRAVRAAHERQEVLN